MSKRVITPKHSNILIDVNQQKQSSQAIISTAGILFSRIFGFIRDALFALTLGGNADIFLIAFRVPNIIRRLAAEGAIGISHMAVLSCFLSTNKTSCCSPVESFKDTKSMQDAISFSYKAMIEVFLFACLFSFFVYLIAHPLIACLAPGFTEEKITRSVFYLRLCLPYIPLIATSAIAGATLNTFDKFGASSFSPFLLNLSIIFFATLFILTMHNSIITMDTFGLNDPALWLCFGVVTGGGLQLLFLVYTMHSLSKVQTIVSSISNNIQVPKGFAIESTTSTHFFYKSKKKLGQRIRPIHTVKGIPWAVAGASSHQINMLIAYGASSFLTSGSISALYFAERLIELPLAIAGATIATVSLSSFATKAKTLDIYGFRVEVAHCILLVLFLSLPCAAGLAGVAKPCITLFFNYGNFGESDVSLTAKILCIFCLGLPAMCLARVFISAVSAFHTSQSQKNSFSLVSFGVSAIAAISCCISFIPLWGMLGVALAIVVGAWTQALFLFIALLSKGLSPQGGYTVLIRGVSYIVGACIMFTILRYIPYTDESRILLGLQLFLVILFFIFLWFFIFSFFPQGESLYLRNAFFSKKHSSL